MKNEITPSYSKALELHNKILVSAQLAQQNLWDMCAGLKEMRDDKLYRELGYQNFEEYCQSEFNMNRSNAHKYISIIENINPENVSTSKHFGVSKLYLLSTLSESEQEKITAENDVESMTVRQLEAEIRELKEKNSELKLDLDELAEEHERTCEQATADSKTISGLRQNISALNQTIEELESRPIEVAVAEPSDEVRQLKLTIKNLERITDEQLANVQEEHLAAEMKLRRDHAAEMEKALREQESTYREKISRLEKLLEQAEQGEMTHDEEQEIFKIYYTAAHDALFNLLSFSSESTDKTACFSGVKKLLIEFEKLNDELIYGRDQ